MNTHVTWPADALEACASDDVYTPQDVGTLAALHRTDARDTIAAATLLNARNAHATHRAEAAVHLMVAVVVVGLLAALALHVWARSA